ncbi:type II toxin-antitoxin system death-on-curing family toxin [Chlorogloeopsis fritschii PCC 9212]|uniref:Fido domain-containing protein n=1 Tax=Chlorogloeopsis fritschii PCC 6912 TaxID=211165 RepID=A0A3S1A098_CHLFR|nr:type II toxin-antitoxin system death-on-curing family toxin [Chlorogloeopsis fritschii]RUR84453.1 hypothetical protein PCC6912_13480 [Chlorogloeopsis fritschii PCC 6912]
MGTPGLIDAGLLSATLARPKHSFCYSENVTLFDLAAAYGYGLAKNHCFIDGNKRISLAVIDVFLRLNGYMLAAPEAEAVVMILGLVEETENQDTLAVWIKDNSQQL